MLFSAIPVLSADADLSRCFDFLTNFVGAGRMKNPSEAGCAVVTSPTRLEAGCSEDGILCWLEV